MWQSDFAMVEPVTQVVGFAADPDVRIRFRWAENLRDAMRDRGVGKYELVERLEAFGIKVTRQAVESWLKGNTAPRPHVQQAIGTVLNMPARTIFLLENAPEQASA